jgi:hypothetical protein
VDEKQGEGGSVTSAHQVYFVQAMIGGQRHVKIGFTKNIPQRIQTLQTGNASDLKFLGSIKCKSEQSARFLEGSLHEMFGIYRGTGEWFKLKAILHDFIVAAINQDEGSLWKALDSFKSRLRKAALRKQQAAEDKAKYGGHWLKPKNNPTPKWGAEKGSIEYYKNIVRCLQTEVEKVRAELLDLRAENALLKKGSR